MNGLANAAVFAEAQELSRRADELAALARRVESEGRSQPRMSAAGWSGPASWACDVALAALRREIDTATELLRCATDLTSTAAWAVSHAGS